MTLKVAILASGRGSNMESILQSAASGLLDARVTLVVTDKPGAACIDKAKAAGVPATVELPREEGEPRSDYDARLQALLEREAPDVIVLAGFMRILGAELVNAFPQQIVNIHPALLPSFKGARGIRDTLRAGARIAGCTTHFVTADLDAGPIILQAAVPVRHDDDEASLAARVLRLEHQILPRTLQLIHEGRVRVEGGRATIAPGPSWKERVEAVPDALYPDAF